MEDVYASQRADVYLLAVLPVHEAANTPNGCGDLNPDQVVFTEAVSYGVDIINNNTAILPGLSLGYIMIDSCSFADRTIFQIDQMYSANTEKGIDFHVASQMFGAVGFTRYNEYAPLAGYLHSKGLLTISATASDSEFSNKEIYPDFMRMVPDQREEINVMFQILKLLGVKYIGILHTDVHPNDVSAIEAMEAANAFDMSVVYIVRITEEVGQNDSDMDYLVETFIERNLNSTTVLMTFAEARELVPLFRAMRRRHVEKVIWIGGNSWFTTLHVDDLLPFAKLLPWAFVVGIATYPVPSFNRQLTQMQSNNPTKGIYMDELLNLMSTCQNQTDKDETDNICNKLYSDMFSHNDAYLIIDSIKALAAGLDEIIHNKCPLGDFCADAKSHLASRLRNNILQYHFSGSTGKNIRFDSKGNGPASFGIHRVVFDEEQISIEYQNVGAFEDGSLSVSSDLSILSLNIRKSDCSSDTCAHVPPEIFGKPYVYIDGDPMLYGFVKLFQRENDDTCSGRVNNNGYQAMESMVWGVTVINNSTTLLPNVKLGLAVFPTCGVATKTKNIVQSVLLPNLVLPTKRLRPNTTILGIVGGEAVGEAISIETATRAVDVEIPVIISSRADVSDGQPHPRLFRTVLSPFAEMDYILELSLQLRWTYIHVVYDPFMESVVKYLGDIFKANGICIASRNILEKSASSEVTRSILVNMTEVEGATAVILVMPPNNAKQVLTVARVLYLLGRLFFVLPFEVYDLESYLSEQDIGVLSTRKDVQINDQFMNYFLSLNIKDKANDPWFANFWQQSNACNLRLSNTYAKDCSNSERLSRSNVIPSPSINGILDSVFSLGHALHGLLRECKTDKYECIKGDRAIFYNNIERYLSAVNFTSPGGTPFKFRDKNTASTALIVTNVQKSPDGGIRLVDVGNFESGKLTLDMRKLSFYRNGLRVMPASDCLGDCRICLEPDFVNAYDARVTSLRSAGPILEHKFFTALGVIDILLIFISFMFITIASYFLCKFYKHKVFNICADADTGILIGCSIMTLSSCCHLFSQTKLMCTLQVAAPALSYAISNASLIVKINKTVCLRSYLGLQQSRVPRWDFALTYIPLLLVPTIIAFFKWMQSDVINISSTVPGIREISNVDEVTITWRCSFD
ncbi:metabotropic glutamate receptor 5-like, partial [Mizuhopecten yessoensis]|uniref:metabotropic glutamate receptor 5-like n=1 Tax=Mizuhopecten yessoensis TaxID=6573 RepID=UPI000B45F554